MSDVNDLLKSLVLQDLGGGKISTVAYDSHDPIEKTLGQGTHGASSTRSCRR